MSSAGQQLVAGRIPGERIATTIETSDSSEIDTTETEVIAVTAPLVNGRTYRVTLHASFELDVASEGEAQLRIREDDASGTQLQTTLFHLATGGGAGFKAHLEVEFTASATGNKTFSGTLVRDSGTGTFEMHAAATAPAYMYVDYIQG